ncbi:MAG: polysaccharide deacetylase family protein [Christensenellaceae bacterium]|jgi:peptidoglycan/xylan/chitin deacetylase (PgdA/CDA1 family)|nr:polysaccharide deacetylase family protein [Christensenellaceae bacterium]
MKILGFWSGNEKGFVHVISNFVILGVILGVGFISLFVPIVSASNFEEGFPIYSGNPNRKNITLMINVYWGTEFIEPMLDIFDAQNVKTTFFVGGMWVTQEEELLKEISGRGHEIANHGYSHKDHKKLNLTQNQDEIYNTHQKVVEVLGLGMKLFAPPSGSFGDITLQVAKNLGYKTIMWSKDTVDWRDQNKQLIFSRATTNLKNGDLILMHPTSKTLEALNDIIISIKTQGFSLVTVSENIA